MVMRKFWTLALSLLASGIVAAQTCNLKVNSVDEFTGESIKETKEVSLVSGTLGYGLALEVKAVDKNGLKYLEIHLSDKVSLAVSEGADFLFKTTSGEIVSLKFYEFSQSKSRNYADYNARHDLYNYLILDEDQLSTLRRSEIEKVRFYGVSGFIEKDIPKKNQDELKKLLACL
jgi:hypothetical protein